MLGDNNNFRFNRLMFSVVFTFLLLDKIKLTSGQKSLFLEKDTFLSGQKSGSFSQRKIFDKNLPKGLFLDLA